MDDRTMRDQLERIPEGDLEALEALYRDFYHAVYSYSLLLLRNPTQAEDNAQDVFLRIWSKASTYRPGGNPKAWIMAIVRNMALDRLRRAGREVGIDDLPEDELVADVPTEQRTVERLDLQNALHILLPVDRQIVLLKAVAGLPAREVARTLGIPPSTVHWRYRRALAKLADRLDEGGTDEQQKKEPRKAIGSPVEESDPRHLVATAHERIES